MTRCRGLLLFACGLAALTAALLCSPLSRGDEPTLRMVRIGFVDPVSLVPRLSTVAMITNPDNPFERSMVKEVVSAAELRHLKLKVIPLRDPDSLQRVLGEARRQGQALLIFGDPLLHSHRRAITAFANQHRMPALYGMRDFVEAGGMMAYGPNTMVTWRRAAEYVDKILRGANLGELPIEQPTQYSLTVNTKVAKALGISIPESILLCADEVIR